MRAGRPALACQFREDNQVCLRRFAIVAFLLLLPAAPGFAFTITPYEPPDTSANAPDAPEQGESPAGPSGEDGELREPPLAPAATPAPPAGQEPPDGQTAQPAPAPEEPAQPVRRPRSQEELGRMSVDDLYRLAFGRSAPERPRNIVMNLIADGWSFGSTEVLYDADFAAFNFISPVFSRYLDSLLLPAARASAGDSVGYFNSAVLRAAGYRLNADDAAYELLLTIPPDIKKVQRMNLRGGYVWQPTGELVEPARLSFYVNYSLTENFMYTRYRDFSGYVTDDGIMRSPAGLVLDGAVTAFRWTLEGSATASEPGAGQPYSWNYIRRGDVRLVHDIMPWNARITLGDVSGLGGARYEYSSRLFGNAPVDEGGVVTFFMPRAGEVDVMINGRYRNRFYLPAGRHEISGFGGDIGYNSVTLVLRMEDGSEDEVPFDYVLGDSRNLSLGEMRYSAVAGFRRLSAPAPLSFTYDDSEPGASADYAYGLTRWLSAGAAAQGSRHNASGSAQLSFDMGPAGWSSVNSGVNRGLDSLGLSGQRVDASYSPRLQPAIDRVNRLLWGGRNVVPALSVSARGYWQSAYYSPGMFSGTASGNPVSGGVSGNLSFPFFRGNAAVTGGATFYRRMAEGAENYYPLGYNYGARLSQSIFGVPISASGGVEVSGGVSRPYFSVNTGYNLGIRPGYSTGFRRHRFTVSSNFGSSLDYNPLVLREVEVPDTVRASEGYEPEYEVVPGDVSTSFGGSARLGWRWSNSGIGVGAQSYSVNANVRSLMNPSAPTVSASASQNYNRGMLTANYYFADNSGRNFGAQSHSVSARWEGALMFADGLWALGRQTTGGFFLADVRKHMKGTGVHVDRAHAYNQDYSRNGWLGAAYQNAINAYTTSQVTLTLTDPPPGAVLNNNRFYVTGGYKQGYALRIGEKATVIMEVKFLDAGKPLSYVYVTIEPEYGALDREGSRATFTGGDGVMQMSGLYPGETYVIKFGAAASVREVLVTIPADAELVYEAGDVTVERGE